MKQQMGQRGRGQECLPPPPPDSARSLFLYPHHLVLPPVLARLSLSQWETVLSLSLPGTAKSDRASGPPQSLAWLRPASPGSCCQPGSSRRPQDWLSPAAADSQPGLLLHSLHVAPGPHSAHLHRGPCPIFPAQLLPRLAQATSLMPLQPRPLVLPSHVVR